MRCSRSVLLVTGLVLAVTGTALAQHTQPIPAKPLQFESWQAASTIEVSTKVTVARLILSERNRTRQALLGGVIGAAAGVVFCTAFSTLIDDSAEGGLSFCPLDTYLLIGGAGFVLGAAIGWVI